jgi:hypothetical protein
MLLHSGGVDWFEIVRRSQAQSLWRVEERLPRHGFTQSAAQASSIGADAVQVAASCPV